MRVISQLAVVAVLAAAGAGIWYWDDLKAHLPLQAAQPAAPAAGSPGAPATPAATGGGRGTAVVVAPARTDTIAVTAEAVGTAQANESVNVTTKVAGLLSAIHFSEGAQVKAGDLLAEIDPGELRATLAERRAQLDQARRLYERAATLYQNRNVSLARVDELETALQAAEARVRADESRLDDYVIRAPFAGRLGLRRVSLGAFLSPGAVITTLDDVSRIKVDFRVPEAVLAYVRPGLPIRAESVSYGSQVFEGAVRTVNTRIDPVTRAIELRAEFANTDGRLRPGMFLTAKIGLVSRPNAIVIPEEAVVAEGAAHFVYAVRQSRAVRTRVTLGERRPGEVEIREGLSAGDSVIVEGLQKVRDGLPVQPQPRQSTNASTS